MKVLFCLGVLFRLTIIQPESYTESWEASETEKRKENSAQVEHWNQHHISVYVLLFVFGSLNVNQYLIAL